MNNPKPVIVDKKKHTLQVLKILYLLLLALVIMALVVFLPKLILIKKISCQSQFGPCNPQMQEALKKAENSDLTFSKKVVNQVLSASVLVKDYSIQFKLPDTLSVNLIERKPKFALTNETQSKFALIDKEAEVLSLTDSSNLPRLITHEELPKIEEKVAEETLFALETVASVSSYYSISSALLEKESLVIELNDAPSLIFPLAGDKEILLGAANLILTQLKSEGENSKIGNVQDVGVIDLRFKNPVIR
jgi:cell division septal protein FtsQ